jgi:4-hydroxy-4-methyl-2-oxoglutarate aldolase
LNRQLSDSFSRLSTPLIADACVRRGIPLRIAPPSIRPVLSKHRVAGGVLPVRHYGSVDIFLEAIGAAEPSDILVIDNEGRMDEACIGDLTVLEVQAFGLGGIVVWGMHRDAEELMQIDLPVFSYGTYAAGPVRLDPRDPDALSSARIGDFLVSKEDVVFGDLDGVIFVHNEKVMDLIDLASSIMEKEREQAKAVRSGSTLRDQFRFEEYLTRRSADPDYTFRKHLRALGRVVEE